MKLTINESDSPVLVQQAELAILRRAQTMNELKFAQKIVDGIKSGNCTEQNFYDFIRKLTKAVRSEKALRGYQVIADYAFDRVFGEGRHTDDWARKPRVTRPQQDTQSNSDVVYVSNLGQSSGDTVYAKKGRSMGSVQIGSDLCLSPDFTGNVKRGGLFIDNGDAYNSRDRALMMCASEESLIDALESGEAKPVAELIDETPEYFELRWL